MKQTQDQADQQVDSQVPATLALRRLFQCLGLIVLFGILPMLAMAVPSTGQPALDKVDPRLIDEIAVNGQANFWIGMAVQADLSAAYDMDWESRGWYVYDTLSGAAERTQSKVIAYLEARGLDYESFWINNAIYVRGGDLAVIQDLAMRHDVIRIKTEEILILPDPPAQVEGTEGTQDNWGLDWVNAPDVWAMGFDGSGIVVANIDTGVQYDHPQLDSTYRGFIDGTHEYNWCDPSDICTGDAPCDNNGHGTHTMGALSGENDDPAGDPNLIGMAPASTWIACKGCELNTCSEFALTQCAQWIVAPTEVIAGSCGTTGSPDPGKRPHIVNNSWGDVISDSWYRSYVQAWRAAGIFPAFSAGNQNTCGSVGSPGDYQESFASANMQSDGSISPSYSSRGPSEFGWEPYCKPNIAAPGTYICSSVPVNSYNCWYQGTSMASPHSAGAVALLWQACPDLLGQIDPTFQVLQSTAAAPPTDPCASTPGCGDIGCNCTYGYGYLDALAAVQRCIGGIDLGSLDGHVYELGTNDPIEGASVMVSPGVLTGSGVLAITDPAGYYTMTLLPGAYKATASKNGYASATITDVAIISGEVTTRDFTLEFLGEWQPGPSNPPFEYHRFDGVFDPHDNRIYFLGGRDSGASHDPSVWTYDPIDDVWADTGCDVVHTASNYTAALVEDDGTGRGEALYLVGGFDVSTGGNISATQRFYPSEPGCLVEDVDADPFPGKVEGIIVGAGGVGVVDDKVYYFGGWQTHAPPYFSEKTWEFDPKRPAGSRWTEIASATLATPRSYIDVAVQNGLIYALGGVYDYADNDLAPTNVVEVFDPSNAGAGWQPRSGMPLATAEGRGFGFQADTLGLNQASGKLYVAGGGDWPARSAQVLEYDVAGDTWSLDFPDLNTARRNHAGATVSVCTPDADDGLPGMWVFGGSVSDVSNDPPYGHPEFFDFSCPAPEPPEAAFTVVDIARNAPLASNMEGCTPLALQFTDVSTGTVLKRSWDFGDLGGASTNWRPTRVYSTAGEFEVTLWVTNTSGSDSITGTVKVSTSPEAAFAYTPTVVYTYTEVHFEDASTGPVAQWLWTFSDGAEYPIQNPTHTFTSPGAYAVTLTVTADSGCSDALSEVVPVRPEFYYFYFPLVFKNASGP